MVVLGIDVGKSDLYACLLRPELKPARQVVTNTAEGQACLQSWLETQGVIAPETSVVMEATGVYWERIALKLHVAGYRVSVVNAAQIKFYA
ncbi:transposase, partial [Deinococcus oregonensis]